VNPGIPLRLEFADEVCPKVRARMAYAFRVFAAVYGHEVWDGKDGNQSQGVLRCVYGGADEDTDSSSCFRIPAQYLLRPPEQPAPKPALCSYAGESLYLFYGKDKTSGSPDWLAEIFEWLSGADEMSVRGRDSVGRVPYDQTIFARHAISPLRPHASLAMAWFQNFLSGQGDSENLPAAPSPLPDARHLVIASHDIDFYFSGRWGSLVRVVKNLAIAVLFARSYPFFKDNLRQLFRILGGGRVGDFLPELLKRSQENGFSSTYFVLARREHRRDANYALPQIAHRLRKVLEAGSSIALHGSYRSIVENSDLGSEVAVLEAETGERPQGSRQHWLRFDGAEKLFANIEKAGLEYDSSWGWADQLGFRHGAAFAFPPYNFTCEEPYNFLLIPLVIMDRGLQTARRTSAEQPAKLAEAVLSESRRWGWGGISVLWHNPVEPLSACDDVNQIFWTELKGKTQRQERWISAEQFMDISLQRYRGAGLLCGLGSDIRPAVKRSIDDHWDPACHSLDVETAPRGFYRGEVQSQKCS
jgi:hypothetical protein